MIRMNIFKFRNKFCKSVWDRGGARHFHLVGPLEGPVLQQVELSMVCLGLQCSGMKSRGKFWGDTGGARQNFGGQCPP